MTSAMRLWSRCELRRRWRSLVVLGLLAGLASGLGLAAISGARQTNTAYTRYRAVTGASDAIVFGTQVGIDNGDYAKVKALPEVEDSGAFSLAAVLLKGTEIGALPPDDSHLYRTIDRPLLREGRLPDPRRIDEITVNQKAAAKYHIHLGDRFTMISSKTLDAFYGIGPIVPGPTAKVTVVGIGDSNLDQSLTSDPAFVPSGAFLARYGDQIEHHDNLMVRLRPGTDPDAFRRHAAAAMGRPDVPIRNELDDAKRITHATDLETTGLLLFAGAVTLAGLVLVGQALARQVDAITDAAGDLTALGSTRSEIARAVAAQLALTAVVAVAVGLGVAVALSPRFPIGVARRVEPALGVHFDAAVLLPGIAVVAALTVGAGWWFALASMRRRTRAAHDRATTPALLRWIRRVGPIPLGLGAQLAFERGRGGRSLPSRSAVVAAMVAVLAVVGALGLVRGIDDAVAVPARSGQTYQAAFAAEDPSQLTPVESLLEKRHDVADVAVMSRANVDVKGAGIPTYSIDERTGSIDFVVLSGHAPRGRDEIAVGPATAQQLGLRLGDTLPLGPSHRMVRIVGTTLLPETPHSAFDQGFWMTTGGFDRVVGADNPDTELELVTNFVPGVRVDQVAGTIATQHGLEFDKPIQPVDVSYLQDVRTLPRVLALFVALLAIAAFAHVFVTTVGRRRHDFAVLRTLGLRPGQSAATMFWQATAMSALALAIGIPLGVIAGRLIWQWVATRTPLVYVPPVSMVATVVLAVPVTLALAYVLVALPARALARVRPTRVLRAD